MQQDCYAFEYIETAAAQIEAAQAQARQGPST